ncbi:MAG TPA: DUF4349 domain-containing protein [Gaiellaceae bacterium]|nr:DUF4349 domain-containing protein [Gaiellaceae bacterium]
MRKILLVGLVAALALVAAACTGGDDESADGASAGGGADAAVADLAEEEAAAGDEAQPVAQRSGGGGSLPSVGPRIVQTASLALSVPRAEFQQTVDSARSIAAGLGGFVVSSSASQGADRRLVAGTLVVRVPGRAYAQAVERLSALGRVEAREETGQDVAAEVVDLEARARHLEAVERQLLQLLEEADTVAAALAVQSELNGVQLELEQVRGRLRHLDDQVAYATIALDVRERAPVAAAGGGGPWSIVDAWSTAAHGFVTVVGWMLVAAATVAPVVVFLLLLYLAARFVARRPLLRGPSA